MNESTFEKDAPHKKMLITREFAGTLPQIWNAWTDSTLLDQWWAPNPWKAETKAMKFLAGGHWLYSMNGPDGEKHWARADYQNIEALEYYEAQDAFCDKNGNVNEELPGMYWKVTFTQTPHGARVVIEITFPNQQAMDQTLAMGFEEGFTAAHANLDELLASQ